MGVKVKTAILKNTSLYIIVIIILVVLSFFFINGYKDKEQLELISYINNHHRFIAHAGGEVGGKKYTNSLEALDKSYKTGFKLLELDIIKTSDDFYVAAHDWKKWKVLTNYQGAIPPTRNEFLKQKIYKNYTPIDLGIINAWFASHEDAILVTDKINSPKDFSEKFVDKKRLMMELFSWEKVKEGLSAGILSAMPTGRLLDQIDGEKVEFLNDLGIKHIAMSHRLLNTHKQLIANLTKSGIKIFAFHINSEKTIGEIYVACNYRKYFYGFYANKWDFISTPNCN